MNVYYKKFKLREEYWDVKILEYIMSFYRERKVFYDLAHPSNFVIRKICEDILKELGIDAKLSLLDKCLDSYEYAIYPDVQEALGLDYGGENDIIRNKSNFKLLPEEDMDFEQYIKQYIYWCHNNTFMAC